MNRGSAQSGFSMVELAAAMAILAGMLLALAGVQKGINRVLSSSSAAGSVNERAVKALEKIANELKWSETSSLLITTDTGASRIDLRIPTGFVAGNPTWSAPITYKVELGGVDADSNGIKDEYRLVRLQGGRKTTLCESLRAGGFTAALSTRNVALSLMLKGNGGGRRVNLTVTSSVSLRN